MKERRGFFPDQRFVWRKGEGRGFNPVGDFGERGRGRDDDGRGGRAMRGV